MEPFLSQRQKLPVRWQPEAVGRHSLFRRESGGPFKEDAVAYIKNFVMNTAELADQPLMRMFTMKHEFPTEWHKFLYPAIEGAEQILSFTIGNERFPFFAKEREIVVMKIDLFAKSTRSGDYLMVYLLLT